MYSDMNWNESCFLFSYLEEYENLYQEASSDVSKYLANPINAYLLVKRLTTDWKQVEGFMTQNSGPGIMGNKISSLPIVPNMFCSHGSLCS